jgi:hypothetical protein
VRVITAEVMKLKRITPPIHTNRELVELFLSRLTPDFASRVAGKLSMHRLVNNTPANPAATPRNPEDMYDIEEVMDMAKQTSLEQANPFGKFLAFAPVQNTSSVKLEEAVARLTDSINLQTQYNKQVEQKLTGLQNFMNQPRAQSSNSYSGNSQLSGYAGKTLSTSQGQSQLSGCFYCGGLHRIPDCEYVLKHLDLGWIKKIEGYIRLPDGSRLPRDQNKSTKDLIEALNKPKPGLIHMNRITDRTGLYSSSGNMSTFSQNDSRREIETPEMRTLLDLVQKLGMDKAQKVLTNQVQVQDEEEDLEWAQNFE